MVDLLPALPLVAGSYLSLWLIQSRVRAWLGRRSAPHLAVFERYDHRGLALGLLPFGEGAGEGSGPAVHQFPEHSPLGQAPKAWREIAWSRQAPALLREARDLVLAGSFPLAAAQAAGQAPAEAIRSLFVWAVVARLFGDELEAAEEAALALPDAEPGSQALSMALLAWVETRRAERLEGPAREAAVERGLGHLRAAGDGFEKDPVWAGLGAHLELLRFSLWNLEWSAWRVRRQVRKALAAFPEEAAPHFLRAHLAARLGEGAWSDHLARALYYARGSSFYAQPILASPRLASLRPGLVAKARTLSERSVKPQVDT